MFVLTNQANSIQPNMLITVIHMMSLGRVYPSGQVTGDSESIQDQRGCMMHVSLCAFNMRCYATGTTDNQSHLENPSSVVCYDSNQVVSSIPHLFRPPRFSQSFSSASIFSQLSSIEGMRGLFSVFSLTHYLAADSQSLLIP